MGRTRIANALIRGKKKEFSKKKKRTFGVFEEIRTPPFKRKYFWRKIYRNYS